MNSSSSIAPLSSNNFLLRGSTLRNTGWIIGVVIYTGFDTKIMQNSRSARTKMSRMESLVNKCIKLVLFAQLIVVGISTGMAMYANYYLYQNPPWYLFPTVGDGDSASEASIGNDTGKEVTKEEEEEKQNIFLFFFSNF